MKSFRPLIVFGTRPEAIKLAPVVHACQAHTEVQPLVCLTAQHREMLDQVVDYFGIEADCDLDTMSPNQTLAELTSRCLLGVDRLLREAQPDCVVVQGDTTTAMTGALAAFYHQLPVVHVEAGLRTGNLLAPWPEEFNRQSIGLTAALHCAPTQTTADNLLRANVPAERVHVTGNTVIDALLWTIERERGNDAWRQRYASLGDQPMVLITAHRRENHGAGLENICLAISRLAERHGDVAFVFPVHLNPNVQRVVGDALGHIPNVHLIEPVPYPEFVWLLDRCHFVLSDSGGVQEEAPSLGKPVLCLRETTERVEAVQAGGVRLIGTDVDAIVQSATGLLTDERLVRSMQVKENPYGDGRAAARTVELMLQHIPRSDVERPDKQSIVAPKESPEKVLGRIADGEPIGDHP